MSELITGTFKKPSPLYNLRSPEWDLIRTISKGRQAVINSNEVMTPKLNNQSNQAYEKYKQWGKLFNALKKTIEAWSGMLFRKPPQLTNKVKANIESIARDGQPLDNTVQAITEEIITLGWVGVLVDYPENDTALLKREKEKKNLKAYASIYPAESVINWDYKTINNQTKLYYVVLEETIKDDKDKFSHKSQTVYRILDFDNDGFYRQRLVDKNGQQLELIEPKRSWERLTYIPFAFGTPSGVNGVLRPSPVLELANLNRSHWISSVDHRQSLHWSGFNQMFVWGVEEDANVKVGEPYTHPNDKARAEIIAGKASSPLKEELTDLKEEMAIVGANALASQGRYVQSAETATINQSSETSILSKMSQSISDYITWILVEVAKWEFPNNDKLHEKIGYKLTTDFLSSTMDPQMIAAQQSLLNEGKITLDTFINNLKTGEIIQENVDNEEYKKQLEKQLQEINERMEQQAIIEVSEIING
jgi:hypothetical protein